MKVMITGTNGFLGIHLLHFFQNKNFELFTITRKKQLLENIKATNFECDIIDNKKMSEIIKKVQPQIFIHCAAMSKPDDCENNKELANKTNYLATCHLVNECKKNDIHFIFLSTDFVYGDGENKTENDQCFPINFYAQTKFLAETFIRCNYNKHTIIRPVFIYGKYIEGSRKSFVQWVFENLKQGKEIKVVDDQNRTPTYVNDICEAIEKIIQQEAYGIFNLCGDEVITPHKMAIEIANTYNLNKKLIKPVNESCFRELAARPKNLILKNEKAKEKLEFISTDFKLNVKKCF